ncbi:tumor protein p63-regulated gene 1-like protein isoform X2 [Rhinatrema bivittatum]|uniref:tumor protein p63-regulated gene 1-like protein isoform X2 n=1 Tax=Rhinatrema bivittatum TaxID=194408 RepID=UPI00112E8974|nr:tumor protein p63-regulated gene 1-like protein isoform X2 [Rhinatrema bivittatum]
MQALPRYRETEEDPHPLPLVIEPRKEHPVPAGTANVSHLYSKEPRLGYSPTSVPVSTSHKNTPGKGEYFILRNGSLEQAIVDVKSVLSPVEDGEVQSIWILTERQGQSLRIGWDKLRPLSFLARWNPWSSDLPYVTLMQHPAAGLEESVSHMFQLEQFQEQLVECVKRAHRENPLPGRANGPLVLEQPIPMETYLGLMSLLSSKAQLGYAKSRGAFGF